MVIEFDCFLIDEVVAVGDSRFHEKCRIELFEKRVDRSFVIVSHDTEYVKHHCKNVYVLKSSKLHSFQNVEEAIDFHINGD